MVFRKMVKKIVSFWKWYYLPDNIDLAYSRRKTLAMSYLISSLLLCVVTTVMLHNVALSPEHVKTKIQGLEPGTKVVKINVDLIGLTVNKETSYIGATEETKGSDGKDQGVNQ